MIRPAASSGLGWGGLAIVLVALGLRLYYIDIAQVDQPLRGDAAQYFAIAKNVLDHGIYSTARPDAAIIVPDSYRGPGYPTLIASLMWLLGSSRQAYWAVLLLQSLLGAVTVGLCIALTTRIMPKAYAFAVGILAAVWPHMITLGGYVLTETIFGFLVVLSIYLFLEVVGGPRRSMIVAAAVSMAIAALVNPIMLGFSLLLVIWYCFGQRDRNAILFALLALGPPMLWAARDAQIQAPPRLSGTSRLMENVLIGAEPEYIPHYKDDGSEPRAVAARDWIASELDAFSTNPNRVLSDIWGKISASPGTYVLWYLSKPAKFWSWSIAQGAGDVYQYPMVVAPFDREASLRLLAALCHAMNTPLMLAAFAGLGIFAVTRRQLVGSQRSAAGLIAVTFVCATGMHSILAPDARYAVPFRPFEFMLAMWTIGIVIDALLHLRSASNQKSGGDDVPRGFGLWSM